MSKHFLITKGLPALAVLGVYWLGSFNLPTVIFLPIALLMAYTTFSLARKHGNKKAREDIKQK
jgi:membrane protein implicated in regulation of membrane protease activity